MKLLKGSAVILGVVALGVITTSYASPDDAGWYVGANLGESKSKIDDSRITSSLLSEGFTVTALKDDDHHFGYKLFGGYQFNRYFALEGGFFDLGEFGFLANTVPAGSLSGNTKIKGGNLDVVGSLPLTDKFSVFARVGANYARANDRFSSSGFVTATNPDPSKGATNYKFGAGLQYDFTRAFGMRLEAERYRIDDAVGNKGDIDLFSAGLLYRFAHHAPVSVPGPPPPPVAPAPAIEPPPVQPEPPPPPKPKRVTFSADSLFDFGKATVKPAGKQSLDQLANDLKGTQFDTITVMGYSDRIGDPAYNQKLSQRRAEAVRAYLVDSLGIPSSKTKVEGMDGSDPVTKPNDCPGKTRSPQLIACLQPDRRVEVEVNATK